MEMFRKFIESLDWPGGSVINLFSLTFLAMLWHAYLTGKTIDHHSSPYTALSLDLMPRCGW
jgi:cbb3-type cytochrome oxidase subunit 3